jgi:hypothetical protein
VVTFVDHEKIGRREVLEPSHQGLHARYSYRMLERRRVAAGDDQRMRYAEDIERARNLLYDFVAVGEDADAIAESNRTGNDLREGDRFARPRRGLVADVTNAVAELRAQPCQIVDLVGTQHQRHSQRRRRQQIGRKLKHGARPPPCHRGD